MPRFIIVPMTTGYNDSMYSTPRTWDLVSIPFYAIPIFPSKLNLLVSDTNLVHGESRSGMLEHYSATECEVWKARLTNLLGIGLFLPSVGNAFS